MNASEKIKTMLGELKFVAVIEFFPPYNNIQFNFTDSDPILTQDNDAHFEMLNLITNDEKAQQINFIKAYQDIDDVYNVEFTIGERVVLKYFLVDFTKKNYNLTYPKSSVELQTIFVLRGSIPVSLGKFRINFSS